MDAIGRLCFLTGFPEKCYNLFERLKTYENITNYCRDYFNLDGNTQ